MFLRISRLLTKYHHLPTLPPNEAPLTPWVKLQEMRSNLGEPIKASHYAKVMRVAKRLNMIEPSLFPEDVTLALDDFKRHFNPYDKKRIVQTPDNYGRAVGSGRRKESTARAWVVEGTGEVLINGKPLNQAFGRVHDRESAIWALQATERLDKYNVWALVEGGGTTGQAEAMTLAVAKALIVHEPALKTALKRGTYHDIENYDLCRMIANFLVSSRMHHERCQNRGEKEARSCQGPQDARLGQAIKRYHSGANDTEPCHGLTGPRILEGIVDGPCSAVFVDANCTNILCNFRIQIRILGLILNKLVHQQVADGRRDERDGEAYMRLSSGRHFCPVHKRDIRLSL